MVKVSRKCSTAFLTHSSVFDDMLSLPPPSVTGQEKGFRLTDSHFEDSATVKLFLDVMSATRNYNVFASLSELYSDSARQLGKLVHFMDKYNSENGIELLRLSCTAAVLHGYCPPSQLFVFASVINDLTLCFRIIEKFPGWTWTNPDRSRVLQPQPHGASEAPSIFLTSHAGFDLSCGMPYQYQWAMTRASLYYDPSKEYEKFAHKFVDIVQIIFDENTRKSSLSNNIADVRVPGVRWNFPCHCRHAESRRLHQAEGVRRLNAHADGSHLRVPKGRLLSWELKKGSRWRCGNLVTSAACFVTVCLTLGMLSSLRQRSELPYRGPHLDVIFNAWIGNLPLHMLPHEICLRFSNVTCALNLNRQSNPPSTHRCSGRFRWTLMSCTECLHARKDACSFHHPVQLVLFVLLH